jgi:hypothetical protein
MDAELLDLKAVVTAVGLGSFVPRAQLLAVSHPALNRRIQRLERSLGSAAGAHHRARGADDGGAERPAGS